MVSGPNRRSNNLLNSVISGIDDILDGRGSMIVTRKGKPFVCAIKLQGCAFEIYLEPTTKEEIIGRYVRARVDIIDSLTARLSSISTNSSPMPEIVTDKFAKIMAYLRQIAGMDGRITLESFYIHR